MARRNLEFRNTNLDRDFTFRVPSGANVSTQASAPPPSVPATGNPDVEERRRQIQSSLAFQRNLAPRDVNQNVLNSIASLEAELANLNVQQSDPIIERQLGFFDEAIPADTVARQRQAVGDIFGGQREVGIGALDELFNRQRGTQLDEAAVTGALRQPGFSSSLARGVDADRGKAIQELLGQLGIGEAQAQLGVGQREQDIGLDVARSKAGIVSGESQFGRQLGLDREQFEFGREFATSGRELDELFRRESLSEQIRGREQQKKGLLDKILVGSQIASNIGTGIGSLGNLRKGKSTGKLGG